MFLPYTDKIHNIYEKLPSQKAYSCGPYTILPILLILGYEKYGEYEVDEDFLAYMARTRMLRSDANKREDILSKIDNGEMTRLEAEKKFYDILYKYRLTITDSEVESGTSVEGVIYALEKVSNNSLKAIPIPSRRGNKIFFTKKVFQKILDIIMKYSEIWKPQIILNYKTNYLIEPTSDKYNLMNILLYWNKPSYFPIWKWTVGHFVGVAGFASFKEKDQLYFIIRDTYKHFGFNGYHLQPEEYVRNALLRDDGKDGGIIVIVDKGKYEEVLKVFNKIPEIYIGLWDNGSPF